MFFLKNIGKEELGKIFEDYHSSTQFPVVVHDELKCSNFTLPLAVCLKLFKFKICQFRAFVFRCWITKACGVNYAVL